MARIILGLLILGSFVLVWFLPDGQGHWLGILFLLGIYIFFFLFFWGVKIYFSSLHQIYEEGKKRGHDEYGNN